MTGAALISTTVPTLVGMGVVSKTTETMFGKGKRDRKSKVSRGRMVKIHQGPRGGKYVIRKGRKIYI